MFFGSLGQEEIRTIFLSILQGLGVVLTIFIVVTPIAIALGIVGAFMQNSRFAVLKLLVRAYVYLITCTPLMLQLFFIYFGLPIINRHLVLSSLSTALLAFVVNYTAYFCRHFYRSLITIDPHQHRAARLLGLRRNQTFLHVTLPQTLRTALPELIEESHSLIRDTSLVVAISVPEILYYTKLAVNRTSTLFPFLVAAVVYILVNSLLKLAFVPIKRKLNY